MALFSCSISPFRVLSANQTMTNAKANWLRFGAFLSPSARLLRLQRSQVTRLPPLATIFPLSARPAGSACRPTPAGYCLPQTAGLPKTERGPISTSTPSLYQYVTEPGDSCGKNNPFLLTRRRATVDRSLVATGSTPPAPGEPAGWPSAAMPVFALLSLISRNSPKVVLRRWIGAPDFTSESAGIGLTSLKRKRRAFENAMSFNALRLPSGLLQATSPASFAFSTTIDLPLYKSLDMVSPGTPSALGTLTSPACPSAYSCRVKLMPSRAWPPACVPRP